MVEVTVLKPSRRYRKVNCTTWKRSFDEKIGQTNYKSEMFVQNLNNLIDDRRKSDGREDRTSL